MTCLCRGLPYRDGQRSFDQHRGLVSGMIFAGADLDSTESMSSAAEQFADHSHRQGGLKEWWAANARAAFSKGMALENYVQRLYNCRNPASRAAFLNLDPRD